MEQNTFNQIQNNFKIFLKTKFHPIPPTSSLKNVPSPIPKGKIIPIEKTTCFGSEDSEIGYKLQFNGRTTIV